MSEGGTARRLWPYLRPDLWAFLAALVLSPVAVGLSLVQPYILKRAIDEHVVAGVAEGLAALAGLFLLAVVVEYLVSAVYVLNLAWVGQRTVVRLRSAVYRHLLRLTQRYLDRQPAGRLLTRATSDVDALGEAFSSGLIGVLVDLLTIVGTLAAMLWLDAQLTLALVLLSPPLLALLELLRRRLRALFRELREALAAVNAFVAERVDGVEVVQLFNHEELTGAQFERRNRRYRHATTRSNWVESLMYSVVDGASSIAVAAMLWYGSGLAVQMGVPLPFDSVVSVGLLVAFVEYLDRLFRPLRELSGRVAILQHGSTALERIFALLDEGETVRTGGAPVETVRGHVVVRGVHFRYRPESEDVIHGVDLEVRPGEVVAVVGATGSGKTTLTRLLDTSYAGYRGSIMLDGRELAGLEPADVRRHVIGVRQDAQLFSETVAFNVDLDRPDITAERRERAARLVHADRVVERLGWDHVLKERGTDVSVGEGQLLTFARAMAHDGEVVILDEATASVDTVTEQLVQDALSRIFARKTVIVVAHRLSTVERADRIAVMERGRIVETGTHAELMAAGGAYARLVRAGEHLV